ncbi:MAG: rod shape-determining protein MreC [Gammaproteobacteria bacterium]|nr:rod shape-determining protein MreC [Gammaproteobacteria bacterium]
MAFSTPDSEPRLFHGPGPGLRLILLVTLAIVLMVLDQRNQHLVQIRNLLGAGLYPLQQLVNAPVALADWAGETLSTRSRLIEENRQFRNELLIQAGRLQRMAALEAENARMRALLDSTAKVGDQVLIAEIVAVDMDRMRHRVVLNRGGKDAVFVGQALIDAQGVVGQVTRDRGTSAEALLITDPDHAVPAEIVRNGLRTIAVGTGDLERLSLPFMARNSDVRSGDLLVSSGLGGAFPPGYPLGTVTEVRGDSGEPFLAVSARPAAALDRVREVLLVIPQEQPETTSGPALEAPAMEAVSTPPDEAPALAPAPEPTPVTAPEPTPAPAPDPAPALFF